jgi:hypothetical protein
MKKIHIQNSVELIDFLKSQLNPYHYQFDESQERSFFWKQIKQNDLRSQYAFSLVLITILDHSITIEGLNEPRLRRAIQAGLIEIESAEDLDELKELVFEADLDELERLQAVLPFFEEQLSIIASQPIHSESYKRALSNIELQVEASNDVRWE